MPSTVCPNCGARWRVSESAESKKVRCAKCQKVFTVVLSRAESIEAQAQQAGRGQQPGTPSETAISRCRYFRCQCGGVFEKEDIETKLLVLGGGNVKITGTRTCARCGTVMNSSDIYAGKYDVPRQYWPQLKQQFGKPAEVISADAPDIAPAGVARGSENPLAAPQEDAGEYQLAPASGEAGSSGGRVSGSNRDQVDALTRVVNQVIRELDSHFRKGDATKTGDLFGQVSSRVRLIQMLDDYWDAKAIKAGNAYEGIPFRELWKGDAHVDRLPVIKRRVAVGIDKMAREIAGGSRPAGSELSEFLETFLLEEKLTAYRDTTFLADEDTIRSLYVLDAGTPAEALAVGVAAAKEIWRDWRKQLGHAPDLNGADLSECQLSGALLQAALLARANLAWTMGLAIDLTGADLSGAKLRHCWWFSPRLEGATLRGADLSNARLGNLTMAGDWRQTRLAGAQIALAGIGERLDLTGADLSECSVSAVKTLWEEFRKLLSPEQQQQVKFSAPSSCFIATACCQDDAAWQVVALRRFRDERLLATPIGRWTVRAYNRTSPPVARAISARPWLRSLLRVALVTPAAWLARAKRS